PMIAAMFAGTELHVPKIEHVVWLTLEIETVAGLFAPTVIAAAPETAGFAVALAMIEAVPPLTAVTTPALSTVAACAFDVDPVPGRSLPPEPASTDAASVTLSPIFIVTDGGDTVTECTTLSNVGPCTLTLSPQAVRPVAAANANAPNTKVERT